MADILAQEPDLFTQPTYLPRVTRRDGRAIEEALAGPTLFNKGVSLAGAVIEATYAATDPPLLGRLREGGVPRLVDPQTTRLTGERFLTIQQFERLPYRTDTPIRVDTPTSSSLAQLARAVMAFEQQVDASWYLTAALPLYDQDLPSWLQHNDKLLEASCAANSAGDLDRRKLIAQIAPGHNAIGQPELIVNRLADYPIDGVYVQPLRMDATRDGVEKLVQYVRFLRAITSLGVPVIASRVSAFGLVLNALGIAIFDSGLGEAEACNLANLNRAPRERETTGSSARGDRRIYLEQLKTTLTGRNATAILENRPLRSRFVCSLGCCEHKGFENLAERRRQHYLWVRDHEIEALRARPTDQMRIDLVYEQLRDAREAGRVVRRALTALGTAGPNFDHIDRWIAVLARETELSQAA